MTTQNQQGAQQTATPVLEATSARHPQVQAQYQHDIAAERKVFPDRRPCPMGKMIRKARESGVTDPSEPILGENIYPYVHFADQQVLRHQLLTPSYHVADVDQLLEIDKEAWERFYLRQGRLRRDGHAIFIHGLGSSAMSVAGHVHAHVFTLGPKINLFDYDQEAARVRIRAGECWLVDTETQEPLAAPEQWAPEESVCDHVYQERFGWA
ncbi:hypothetical protein GCM10022261_05020 [Brevibacterium daeguense]|uniref:Diadenosine tetraphosphate (Ap4A) hydrolase n=1 Tax=Brevibacterium daeguense TaxID=909936 RepID=A0ABP8EG69_9MICO|nr:hypothetical protein [Brevibacterium daeguense]